MQPSINRTTTTKNAPKYDIASMMKHAKISTKPTRRKLKQHSEGN